MTLLPSLLSSPHHSCIGHIVCQVPGHYQEEAVPVHNPRQAVAGPWQRHMDGAEEKEDSSLPLLLLFLSPPISRQLKNLSPHYLFTPLPTLSPEGARSRAGAFGGQAGGRHEDPCGPGWAGPYSHSGEMTPETRCWEWAEITQRRGWHKQLRSPRALRSISCCHLPWGPLYGPYVTFLRPPGEVGRRCGTSLPLGLCHGFG